MTKAGRPSLPDTIKTLSGTLRKDRTREGIEFTPITVVPKPEVWLDTKAKKYFKNICELLIGKSLLNDGNVQMVILMAQEFARYEKAQRMLKKGGEVLKSGRNGYQQPSPWVAISNQAQKNYRDIASLFGMDPLSSQKIGPARKEKQDDFEALTRKYEK